MTRITLRVRELLILSSTLLAAASTFAGADHHMHIHSDSAAEVWAAMCDAMPGSCDDEMQAPTSASTGSDAIQVLDAAGLDKGLILSLGYFYGVPELADSKFNDYRLVRAENAYVAEQVSNFPDRLVGFFSVNPLAEYAIEEVTYWAEHGGLAGLKLHLANSDIDFKNPLHIAKLCEVFDVMNEFALPVVIHLRNRNPEYGYADAALFINEVAKYAPKVTLQLAHVAGWGGYDAQTDGAVKAFLDAIDDGVLDRSKVWFDIAALVTTRMPDKVYASLPARLREIGFDRLLFATDWDEVDPKSHIATVRKHLSLSDEEWGQLMSNEAPYSQ